MLAKLKANIEVVVGFVLMIVTGAFLYERSRRKSAEAVADNKEVLDKINEGDKDISKNTGLLEAEEVKREEIKKEAENAKNDGSNDDIAEFLKRR